MSAHLIDYVNDSRYKKYQAAVEKTLQSFESVGEWADIISFLNRLNKTFNSFPFPVIPEKILVNKRLSQCLNPNLPGGVHQKALEVYETLFTKIRAEGLSTDLGLYSIGLFPLYEHAATMVKTALLNLFEKHFLGLVDLPCLPSLVLSIIPGLEDETGEHFQRVFDILRGLKRQHGKEFYRIVWFLMASSSKHRAAMINYLMRDLPSGPHSEKTHLMVCGGDPDLTCEALVAALKDRQPLVVRGVLDLMMGHFPLSSSLFTDEQLLPVVREAILVLLRRDMSLTRRYYMWVAPEDRSSDRALSLQSGAFNLLLQEMNPAVLETVLKPFKALVFVMDKPVIADPILDSILYPAISLFKQSYEQLSTREDHEKALTAANLFFDNIELDVAWCKLLRLLVQPGDWLELFGVIRFSVEKVSLCDERAKMVHLPMLLLLLSQQILADVDGERVVEMVDLARFVLDKILDRSWSASQLHFSPLSISSPSNATETLSAFLATGKSPAETSPSFTAYSCLTSCQNILHSQCWTSPAIFPAVLAVNERLCTHLFSSGAILYDEGYGEDGVGFGQEWIGCLCSTILRVESKDWWCPALSSLARLSQLSDRFLPSDATFSSSFTSLIWESLLSGQLELESFCRLLVHLDTLTEDQDGRLVEDFLAASLGKGSHLDRIKALETVSSVWSLSMRTRDTSTCGVLYPTALLRLLASLTSGTVAVREAARHWLLSSLDLAPPILDVLLGLVADALPSIDTRDGEDDVSLPVYTRCFDAARLSHALSSLSAALLLLASDAPLFESLSDRHPPLSLLDAISHQFLFTTTNESGYTYVSMMVQVLLPLLCAQMPETPILDGALVEQVQKVILDILATILRHEGGSLTSRELSPLCSSIRALLHSATTSTLHPTIPSQTPALLQLLTALLALRWEGVPEASSFTPLACRALSLATESSVIRAWMDFSVKTAEYTSGGGGCWSSFLEPQLAALTARLTAKIDDILLAQSIVSGIEQIGLLGISLTLTQPSDPASSKSKPRRFESFRAALVRNNSAAQLTTGNGAEMMDEVARSLQGPILQLGRLLASRTCSGLVERPIFDALKRLYTASPQCCLQSLLSATSIPLDLLNLNISPFSEDFYPTTLALLPRLYTSPDPESLAQMVALLTTASTATINPVFTVEAWTLVAGPLMREVSSQISKYRPVIPPLLSWACHLLQVMASLGDDDLRSSNSNSPYESFYKLIEHVIISCTRLIDPANWPEWPSADIDDDAALFDRMARLHKDPVSVSMGRFLVTRLLPAAPAILRETTSSTTGSLFSSVWSLLVAPVIKGSIRRHYPGLFGAACFKQLISCPGASRAWRKDLAECIQDSQFFLLPTPAGSQLSTLYLPALAISLAAPESSPAESRLSDFAGKPSSAPSTATLFLSRDLEYSLRAAHTKRLAFILLAARPADVQQQVPAIQERVVEVLRQNGGQPSPEVFLLWRVLLLRVGYENMFGLWPIILTESFQLVQLMLAVQRDRPPKDLATTFIQLCKLIDTIILLASPALLLYHWNVFPMSPDPSSTTITMMGQVAAKFFPDSEPIGESTLPSGPLLSGRISEFSQLAPFIQSLLIHRHRHLHRAITPDIPAIERDILGDFIETAGDERT